METFPDDLVTIVARETDHDVLVRLAAAVLSSPASDNDELDDVGQAS